MAECLNLCLQYNHPLVTSERDNYSVSQIENSGRLAHGTQQCVKHSVKVASTGTGEHFCDVAEKEIRILPKNLEKICGVIITA